jgi:hypothetical protein
MEKIRFRDPGWKKVGSRIRNPEKHPGPQHCYLDFENSAKNILKLDFSFYVCRRRDLPVLHLDFVSTAKNILCIFLCVQEKEYLPVRALYFGDTGTPLDRKEARFNLGPLECHGDTLFTHSVTFRRQVCVVFLRSCTVPYLNLTLA